MRVAIMQPYLFPYLGYFQLLHSVDAFVLLDDVAFTKKGWINRNRLLVNQASYRFTLPVTASSQHRLIQHTRLYPDYRGRTKLLATISQAYHQAPEFARVFPMVKQLLLASEPDLTTLAQTSLEYLNAYVGQPKLVLRSSALPKPTKATGQARILNICRELGADEYVNLPGGKALYSAAGFAEQGVKLWFLEPALVAYPQPSPAFVPSLSIIDVLMHNSPAHVQELFTAASLH